MPESLNEVKLSEPYVLILLQIFLSQDAETFFFFLLNIAAE